VSGSLTCDALACVLNGSSEREPGLADDGVAADAVEDYHFVLVAKSAFPALVIKQNHEVGLGLYGLKRNAWC
jgi:hypothetical protein